MCTVPPGPRHLSPRLPWEQLLTQPQPPGPPLPSNSLAGGGCTRIPVHGQTPRSTRQHPVGPQVKRASKPALLGIPGPTLPTRDSIQATFYVVFQFLVATFWKETDDSNFNDIFYLTQYIQMVIFFTMQSTRTLLRRYFTFFWYCLQNLLRILCCQHISV